MIGFPAHEKHVNPAGIDKEHCHAIIKGAADRCGLTCEPAHQLCDASHNLLIRERLHIFRLMPGNPTTQHVAKP